MKYSKKDALKPYTDSVNAYLMNGWEGVLTLPAKSKFAPPSGFTGNDGKMPDEDDIAKFITKGGNVALRLPDNIIGLDIDGYGQKIGQQTFIEKINELGNLPETWTSSRHANLEEGRTMLFRVPSGSSFISGLKDIDVIQHSHRYLTAPPSIHPTEVPYSWYSPSGYKVDRLIVPEVDDIAELPSAWLEHLTTKKQKSHEFNYADVDGINKWDSDLGWLPQGNLCQYQSNNVYYYNQKFKTASSRHDQCVTAVMKMLYDGVDGHTGTRYALSKLRDIFVPMIALDRGPQVAAMEFDSIVTWGVAQMKLNLKGNACKSVDKCKGYNFKFELPDITAPEPMKKKQGIVYGNISKA